MNIQYLHTFKAITESDSFAEAADKLNYTRSTVTFHIQQLESELGYKLFEKIGRKMALTQYGRDILPYVDSILMNHSRLTSISGNPKGKVRVAVVESYLVFRFPGIIKRIRDFFPDIEVNICSVSCSEMYNSIRNGEIDIAIHYDTLDPDPAIITERFHDYPLTVFEGAAPKSPPVAEEHCDNKHNVTFIDLEENGFYKHCLNNALCGLQSYNVANAMVISNVSALIECVKAGLGIAILPFFAIEKELARKSVRTISCTPCPNFITIAVSYHRNKWLSPAIAVVLDTIKQTV